MDDQIMPIREALANTIQAARQHLDELKPHFSSDPDKMRLLGENIATGEALLNGVACRLSARCVYENLRALML